MKKNKQPIKDSETSRKYALNSSIRYLTARARSVKEVYDYLLQKNYTEQTINYVLKRLIDLKFLDDKNFGEQWIESRQKYRGKSKYIIMQELKKKGLSETTIEPLLDSAQDDIDIARSLFHKRKDKIKGKNKFDFNNKIGLFLARRGFSWEIIRKVIKEND